MSSKSARARRSACLGFAVVLLMLGLRPAAPSAQQGTQGLFFVSGRNVNTVGPPSAQVSGQVPEFGDPLFKQQNEVDCDVSPNDSRLVFCANNDYRGIEAFGDSWIGVTISDDGGLTWKSRLHNGYPATTGTQVGAADPVVATVPGLGLVGHITISRTDSRGTLRLGRWLERNKENGDRYAFLDNVVIGSGTPGRFADKPAMVAVLTQGGLGGGVTTVGGRDVPNGVIHFGYAIFPGNANNSSSEIYHLMSTDYGRTWSNPKKLSESVGINQGIDFAVGGNTVVATWRRVKDNNEPDAIMFARSTDGGKTWSKASALSSGTFFDQDSSDLQFRTRSMPSIVHDGSTFHVFWAARGFAANANDARVVVASSTAGATWPASPTPVDNHAGRGHQLMPTAAVAGGRVQVNWLDSRNNSAGPFPEPRTSSFGPALDDFIYDDPDSTLTGKSVYRQAVDVYAAQAAWGGALAFGGAQQVSRYRTALIEVPGTPPRQLSGQVEYNFINARMFKQGAWPFHGDYHTVASRRYRPDPATPGAWIANTTPSDSHAVFYSAFTDNRDVRGYVWAGPTNTSFTGVGMQGESGAEVPGPVSCQPVVLGPDDSYVWAPDNSPRSRDQNVYAAATLPGLLVESPSGSKPIGTLQRAYVVTVYNLTPQARTYKLTIATPPAGVFASWERCEPETQCTAVPQLTSDIDHRSSITRTVYVRSTEARPRIVVNVEEQVADEQTAQTGSVILNADPSAPQIEQPDGNLADILSNEIYEPDILARQTSLYTSELSNPELVPVPSVATPRIEYPRIEYPRIEYDTVGNPRIEYPRIEYPRIEYDAVGNPRIEYPRIEYPRIEYKAIENPRIEYSALSGDVTEITWPVTTDGANTTTAMTAKVFVNGGLPSGTQAQILVTVPYATGVANSCSPENAASLVDSQVIVDTSVASALLDATLTPPEVVNPPSWQPSFPVKPGQTVWVTLRIRGVQDANLAGRAGLWVRSQPDVAADSGMVDEAMDGVVDVTAPIFGVAEGTVLATAEATGPGGAVVNYTVTATDGVDAAPTVTCAPVSGSTFGLGQTPVGCTAQDASGNSTRANFFVVVEDKTAPAFGEPGAQLATTPATGPSGAAVTYTLPAATDLVDSAPTVSCTPASGSTFGLGEHFVYCTATDASGNEAKATFTVTVTNNAPTFTPPANISVPATSAAGAVVTFVANGSDIEDGAISAVCTPPSGSTFPLGATTVNCVVTDSRGASASGPFTVTVRDTTAPEVGPHGNVMAEATSPSGAVVNYELPNATDNVGVASLTCTPASGSTFAIGTTTVVCTAMDAAGNTSMPSTFTVTVADTTPPVIVEAATPTVLIWSPNKIMTPVTVSGSITDATTVTATYTIVDEYGTYNATSLLSIPNADGSYSFVVLLEAWRNGNDSDGRTYTITVTATDINGNTASKSVVVKVPHNR